MSDNRAANSPEDPDDSELVSLLESLGATIRRGKSGRVLSVDCRTCPQAVDNKLAASLVRLPRLKEIYLNESQITDIAIEAIAGLDRLHVLNLDGTSVSDQAIELLVDRPKLQLLSITGTKVSREKVAWMRKKMIGTRIVYR